MKTFLIGALALGSLALTTPAEAGGRWHDHGHGYHGGGHRGWDRGGWGRGGDHYYRGDADSWRRGPRVIENNYYYDQPRRYYDRRPAEYVRENNYYYNNRPYYPSRGGSFFSSGGYNGSTGIAVWSD